MVGRATLPPTFADLAAGRDPQAIEIDDTLCWRSPLSTGTTVGSAGRDRLLALQVLFETEVVELAGPKGRHDAGRTRKRHGTVDGTVTAGRRQVSVSRRGCAPSTALPKRQSAP